MDLQSYLAIGVAFFAVAVSPGPANIANAVIAMSRGRQASFVFSLGLTAGIAAWGVVAATGLGAVMQASVVLFTVLKIAGGLYLLWLAWKSGRNALNPAADPMVDTGEGRWFQRGLMLNVSNPKTVVAWMAALAVGLDQGASVAALGTGVLICTFVAFGVFMGYMAVFSTGGMRAVYARVRRWIDGAVACLFAAAGVGLIRSALTR